MKLKRIPPTMDDLRDSYLMTVPHLHNGITTVGYLSKEAMVLKEDSNPNEEGALTNLNMTRSQLVIYPTITPHINSKTKEERGVHGGVRKRRRGDLDQEPDRSLEIEERDPERGGPGREDEAKVMMISIVFLPSCLGHVLEERQWSESLLMSRLKPGRRILSL